MALKLQIGTSQKLGLPRYGSRGASCALELELDASLLVRDPADLSRQMEQAFALCREAVAAELRLQAEQPPDGLARGPDANPEVDRASSAGPSRDGPDGDFHMCALPLTLRQSHAIEGMAARHHLDLSAILASRTGKQRLDELTRAEASRLIAELQTLREAALSA